ncbi:MAG: hypothetical protein EPN30_11430 [Actinomycetota bacterium]|nr:MAG: hypothetical protein EPN30_11430 [Actinomycetota bacterium]
MHKVLVNSVKISRNVKRIVMEDPTPAAKEDPIIESGDAACWAHLVCPECGAIETDGHRNGCSLDSQNAK